VSACLGYMWLFETKDYFQPCSSFAFILTFYFQFYSVQSGILYQCKLLLFQTLHHNNYCYNYTSSHLVDWHQECGRQKHLHSQLCNLKKRHHTHALYQYVKITHGHISFPYGACYKLIYTLANCFAELV